MAVSENPAIESGDSGEGSSSSPKSPKGIRFWGVIAALSLLSFICALDVAIITTSLPAIVSAIGGATEYVWIANSFVVASSVLQPLVGQVSDLFGRFIPLITSTALFLLGSGIAGGAKNPAMLIGGRTVQGIGAGGLYVLLDIVCCDLVPLRERGKYLGLINSFAALAAALGPVLGGAIAQSNWRWIFYLNIPLCSVALAVVLTFMRVKTGTPDGKGSVLSRVDYLGNLIFIPSMIAILFGLISGGIEFPWSSWRVILPLVLGAVGWVSFHIQQHFAQHPSIPSRLFSNRTSAAGYLLTFLSSVLVQAVAYFMPIYFQAVLGTSILHSGLYFLPFAIGTLLFAVVGGVLMSTFGTYRLLHATSFAFSAIGLGLFTLLDSHSSTALWVIFQLLASVGLGITQSTLLPAIMAALPEANVASATAFYAFVRTFGYIWGVTIASVVFNSLFDANLHLISDPSLRDQLQNGAAYAFASRVHQIRNMYSPETLSQVQAVYVISLRGIWYIGLGLSILGFLIVGLERSLELRKDLDTAYGLQEAEKEKSQDISLVARDKQTSGMVNDTGVSN
ncbi:MFS general substrate transporter [Xylariaceae sp. AK1471]|nr:MFS general substrate transporter [Xylariaceae sp. AK1471]